MLGKTYAVSDQHRNARIANRLSFLIVQIDNDAIGLSDDFRFASEAGLAIEQIARSFPAEALRAGQRCLRKEIESMAEALKRR